MTWLTEALAWLADPAHWRGPDGVPQRLLEHVGLSAAAVGIACLLAVPLALWLGHVGRGGALAVNVSNIGRAVPTLALVLFAIPPVLTNTYVGVREVDPGIVDAARGMGMSGPQVLRRVELPLATPLILTGVRLAAVQVVATATIAALVAGGGLGRIITSGFGRQDQAQLVAGAILVALLALVVEGVLALVQRRLDPVGRTGGDAEPSVPRPTVAST